MAPASKADERDERSESSNLSLSAIKKEPGVSGLFLYACAVVRTFTLAAATEARLTADPEASLGR